MPNGEDEGGTQETPAGYRIPIPSRGQVFRDFRKIAGPASPITDENQSDGDGGSPKDE